MKNLYNFDYNLIAPDKKIKFFLDKNWEGEGIIKDISHDCVTVELTKPCKEFQINSTIFVFKDEIYSID